MQRTSVESSNIYSVGYDRSASILEVEFHGQRVYQYFNVPEHEYSGLLSASSKGRYLDRNIKKAGYRYREVG